MGDLPYHGGTCAWARDYSGAVRPTSVELRLLGPLEALRDGRRVRLGGRRQRTMLAALALQLGRAMSWEALVDAVWGEQPPATARQQIHSSISGLRQALGPVIATTAAGYELCPISASVDVTVFEAQVERARRSEERRVGKECRSRWSPDH